MLYFLKFVSFQDFNELMVRGFNSENRPKPSTQAAERAKTSSHVQLVTLDSPRTEILPDEFYQDLIEK